ncbi:hypothetical protein D3C85_658020 [compost metagenome]
MGPTVHDVFHIVGCHDLRIIFQGLAGAFAHDFGDDLVAAAIEEHGFSSQVGFLIADTGRGADGGRHQGNRNDFVGLQAFGAAADAGNGRTHHDHARTWRIGQRQGLAQFTLQCLVVVAGDTRQRALRDFFRRLRLRVELGGLNVNTGVFTDIELRVDPTHHVHTRRRLGLLELTVVLEKAGIILGLGNGARTPHHSQGGDAQRAHHEGKLHTVTPVIGTTTVKRNGLTGTGKS